MNTEDIKRKVALKRKFRVTMAALVNDTDRLNCDERVAIRWALATMGFSVCIQCDTLFSGDACFCSEPCVNMAAERLK